MAVLRIHYIDGMAIEYRRGMFLDIVKRTMPYSESLESLSRGFEKAVFKRLNNRKKISGYELFQIIESEIRSRKFDGLAEQFRAKMQEFL